MFTSTYSITLAVRKATIVVENPTDKRAKLIRDDVFFNFTAKALDETNLKTI